MKSFFKNTWRDLLALPRDLWHDCNALIIITLILLPWLILFFYKKGNWDSLQPLTWILALVAFYWLIGHRRASPFLQVRRPQLELALVLVLVILWILYRVGEYWHWVVIPTLGLQVSCGPISESPIPKMLEMFLLPLLLLLVLRYSFDVMGFSFDRFSWLASLLPIVFLIVYGLINHPLGRFAVSSACFFFDAGLPEEFLFRAFLQTRLQAVVRHPLWAVWLASFIFGLSHVPIDLAGSFLHWQDKLLTAFTYQMSVGFALGYAYMRVRSVLPLSLIHTFIDAAA